MSSEKGEDIAVTQPLYPIIQNQGPPYPEAGESRPYSDAGPCPPYTVNTPPPVVVVEQTKVIRSQSDVGKSRAFVGQIVLSCIVTWCCCILFGLIAFILAMVANCKSASGNVRESKRLGTASYCLSVIGLILGFIIISMLVGIYIGLLLANRGYFKWMRS